MKHFLVLVIFLSAYVNSCLAQTSPMTDFTNPAEILPLASKSLMLDVVKVSEQSLIAVGERGHILQSSDGKNWQQQPINVNSTLTKVFFFNELLGWAVGHDSLIVHTSDGGTTWLVQQFLPEKQRPLFDVKFFSQTHGIAIGAYGTMFRTNDGGVNWQEEFHIELLNVDDQIYLEELKLEDEEFYLEELVSILPHFNRLLIKGDALYIAGEIGLLAKSNDNGKSFELLDEIYQGSFFDIEQYQQGIVVVGLRGNVFMQTENEQTWQQLATATTALLNDIVIAKPGQLLILGNSGTLLKIDNGDELTSQVQADGKALIAGVWFQNKLVVASEVGMKVLDVN